MGELKCGVKMDKVQGQIKIGEMELKLRKYMN